MARVIGAKRHAANLRRIAGPAMVRNIGKALVAAGEAVADEAKGSIMRGAASGMRHVPSRPGEPPKNDTGVLHDSIQVIQVEPLKVEVFADAEYAVALEFGTSKMAERPFMRPAVAARRKEAVQLVRAAVNHVVRGGRIS